jgi:hypothetical protein
VNTVPDERERLGLHRPDAPAAPDRPLDPPTADISEAARAKARELIARLRAALPGEEVET